jgi:hypothetical protein
MVVLHMPKVMISRLFTTSCSSPPRAVPTSREASSPPRAGLRARRRARRRTGRVGARCRLDPSAEGARETTRRILFLGFLVIVITSFKPSSDRHLPQLPSVRHQFSSPVGRLVCGLVFGLRARPSVGRLVCGQVMSMIRSATHLTRATWILPMRAYFVRAKTVFFNRKYF